jgi:hypothetical protein
MNAWLPITLFFNINYEQNAARDFNGFIDASFTPFQLGLYSPFQLFCYDATVYGARLNLFYGKNAALYGLDAGMFNNSGRFGGIEIGAYNRIAEYGYGVQAGLVNYNKSFSGIQLGLLGQLNESDFTGLNLATVALTRGDVNGLQLGLLCNYGDEFLLPQLSGGVNIADSTMMQISGLGNLAMVNMYGPQVSTGFNYSHKHSRGQLAGLFNYTQGKAMLGQASLFYNYAGFAPVQVAGFGNQARNEAWIQLAGVFNAVTEDISRAPLGTGFDPWIQLSSVFNLAEGTWVQLAAVNLDWDRNYVQLGAINFAEKSNFQVGGINVGFKVQGVQAGLVNFAEGKRVCSWARSI